MIDGPRPALATLHDMNHGDGGDISGMPWVPCHMLRPAITRNFWGAAFVDNAAELEVSAIPAFPELGMIISGAPLGLLTADALLAAGCPEEIVAEVRLWLGVDGAEALYAIKHRGEDLPVLSPAEGEALYDAACKALESTP